MDKIAQRFGSDRRGAIAVNLALVIVPLVMAVGLAVDYAMVSRQRSGLQQVVDAVAIALTRDPDLNGLSPTLINMRAKKYAEAMSGKVPVEGLSINATVTSETVHIDGSGNISLNFGAFFGQDTMPIKTAVTVQRPNAPLLEIALSLDSTGSMAANDKMNQLKLAVSAMVDYLVDPAKNASPTRMAMIPFNTRVKVPSASMPDSLLGAPKDFSYKGCFEDRALPYNTSDSSPLPGVDNSKFNWGSSQIYYDLWDILHLFPKTHYVAYDCGALVQSIPLTTNLLSVKTAANTLVPEGNTNVTIGVIWGTHALTSGSPLTEASPPDTKNINRVLIVMTDGLNTGDRFGDNTGGRIDNETLKACAAAKSAKLTVYTIRLMDGNENVLRDCATNPQNYFNVTNPSELTPLFLKIAGQLSKLRISQ